MQPIQSTATEEWTEMPEIYPLSKDDVQKIMHENFYRRVESCMIAMETLYGSFTPKEFANELFRQRISGKGLCANFERSVQLLNVSAELYYCRYVGKKDSRAEDRKAILGIAREMLTLK